MAQRKDQTVETLRGIAIILLVTAHVISDDPSKGMGVSEKSLFSYYYFTFEYFRMPLFTVISGFVYAIRPVQVGKMLSFLKGKARRILLPLIFVSSAQFIAKAVIPGVSTPTNLANIWGIYIMPYDQFWFLQAIFLAFLSVMVLDRFQLMRTWVHWLVCVLIIFAISLFLPGITYIFSFHKFLYLWPFFILGIGLNRFHDVIFQRKVMVPLFVVFAIAIIIQQMIWFGLMDMDLARRDWLSLLIGLTGTISLFAVRREFRPLARLGFYSYAIYLFHIFPTAGSRIFLERLGLDHNIFIFVMGTVFGLGIPILIEMILLKSKILRRLFLGLR